MKTLLTLCCLAAAVHAQAKRPNVVVFLTDDLGWGDLGCYGHPRIQTPHLDRFAKEGLRLTECYSASSVCSPSRAAILTGRTPYRNGVFTWIPAGRDVHLRRSEIALPRLLADAGYATCHAGKWHLNGHFNDERHPQPGDHGYDWWIATQNNAAPSHKNPRNFVRNGKPVGPMQGFSAVLVVEEAIRWLREHRDKSKPFYLAVWTHEPHLPIESDPRFMKHYEGEPDGVRQHHGNVTQTDHAFGMLMKALDDLALRDDTFVMFTSDNGPEGDGKRGRTRGSTGGLRGRKRAMYEGGIRVPGIVRWPGKVQPGTESAAPVIGSDIFPTVCEIAGVAVPKDRTIDGASMLPLFAGGTITRKQPLYWRWFGAPHGLHMALRRGDLKILASEDLTKVELYDLAKDPREQNDLAASAPGDLEAMKSLLATHNRAVEAEGPDWWKTYRRRRTGRVGKGVDETGSFDVVRGGTITKGKLGFELRGRGEAFALRKLERPERERLELRASFRTTVDGRTRNACIVFGPNARNRDLLKVGSMIGMQQHGIFRGAWSNLSRGKSVARKYDPRKLIEVHVVVDLGKRTVKATVDGNALEMPLPEKVKRITHVGYYVKGTASTFSEIRH